MPDPADRVPGGGLVAGGEDTVGDLAIVLHAHMPYVEGFGTYPFGEEWLFDAVIGSHLPVMASARDLTVSITPVLADQLENREVGSRLRDFLAEHRIGAARRDVDSTEGILREAAEAHQGRFEASLDLLERLDGDPLGAFAGPAREGRVELMASSATHAVLPLLATERGIGVQVSSGVASHRRRFGWGGGFWLPECAFSPGIEFDLAAHGVDWFCVDQSRWQDGDDCLGPIATEAGQVAFPIDWEAVSWLWDMSGYPSWPGYADFHRQSMNGMRLFKISGEPYERDAALERAGEDANSFLADAAARLGGYRDRTGRRGLMVFACDMELLGHWWAEGPVWLERVLDRAEQAGIRLLTLGRAAAEAREAGLREVDLEPATWGRGKDFRTWDSPAQADITDGARRLEVRVAKAIAAGLTGVRAERATRELLAVQSSDWAFLDSTGQAGDYPFERSLDHARNAFEALDSSSEEPSGGRLRGLAPDLDLTPMKVP